MDRTWLDDRGAFLTDRCPLPLDQPFTARQAADLGVGRRSMRRLVGSGCIRPVLREVYAVAQAPDDTLLRAQALALVVPPTAVVSDRTAAWLHGVDVLPRSALHTPPPLDIVHVDDTRVRRPEVDGRRRTLLASDVTTVHGVRVTTALRTSLDLGRLLWRFDALAAIDQFLALGVPHDLLAAEVGRFRGFRRVRQLRALVPLGDPRAESPGESALRLHWYDAGLPRPEVQWWVYDDDGVPVYRLDLADPEVPYAAEYDGVEFHASPEQQRHDSDRRQWLTDERRFAIDVLTKAEVYDRPAEAATVLRRGYEQARRATSRWTPARR